jgi:hypothetical protein
VIFELLLRKDSKFDDVVSLLKKLKHSPDTFKAKIDYTKSILEGSGILKSDGKLFSSARRLLNFGNLGNPQHNVALEAASQDNCLMNMAYLVAFQMFGTVAASTIIKYLKGQQFKGGDLKVIHDFLVDIGSRINIVAIPEKQIAAEMNAKCSTSVKAQPFFRLLIKIMAKTRQLLVANNNNIPAPGNRWDDILTIFMAAYKNKTYFNQSLFGGNKFYY